MAKEKNNTTTGEKDSKPAAKPPGERGKKFSKEYQPDPGHRRRPFALKMYEEFVQATEVVVTKNKDGAIISKEHMSRYEIMLRKAYELACAGNTKMLTLMLNIDNAGKTQLLMIQQMILNDQNSDKNILAALIESGKIQMDNPPEGFTPYSEEKDPLMQREQ